MADATSKLEILVQLRDEANTSIRRLSDDLSDLGGSFRFAEGMGGALLGTLQAIGAGAVLGGAIGAFADGESKMAKFDAILKTLPPDLQAFRSEILRVSDEALLKFGFDNEDAALSIARLMQVTRDAPFSFQAFQAAMDLARFKGVSLEEATQSLIMAFGGNARMLKTLGISVDEHASKYTILAAVQKVVTGQAQAFADTSKGSIEIFKALGGEAQEALGSQFGGAINRAKNWLVEFITELGGLGAAMEYVKPILTFLSIFLGTIFVVGIAAATIAFMSMIGVSGLVVAAIAAIAAVLTLLYTLWKTYWPDIKKKFEEAWSGIKTIFDTIWGSITKGITEGIEKIKKAIQSVIEFYQKAKDMVGGAISKVGSKIPKFADGGIVNSPTIGMIGEAGPEAVIPLSRLGGMGGGSGITINLNGDMYTDDETATKFADSIARLLKNQLNLGGIRA